MPFRSPSLKRVQSFSCYAPSSLQPIETAFTCFFVAVVVALVVFDRVVAVVAAVTVVVVVKLLSLGRQNSPTAVSLSVLIRQHDGRRHDVALFVKLH